MTPPFSSRLATPADIPALHELMNASIQVLLGQFLQGEELAAAYGIMGIDTQLIDDGTYFAIEAGDVIVGCGGWSRRSTLFGGDHTPGRDAALLSPERDAARVRAMYTHPDWARRGIGRLVLSLCETAAASEGFTRVELVATPAGEPLYRACGYRELERWDEVTPDGIALPVLRMGKSLG